MKRIGMLLATIAAIVIPGMILVTIANSQSRYYEDGTTGILRLIRSSTTFEYTEDFLADAGATLPVPWAFNDETANVVSDYVADEARGMYQLALDATDEAQAVQVTWGNQLSVNLSKDPIVEFRIRVDGIGDLISVEQILIGLCPDHTNAETASDDIDDSIWFLMKGATATTIYVEADDTTANEANDQDSTLTLVDDTWTVFTIDFNTLTNVIMSVDGVEQGGAAIVMTGSADTMVQPVVILQRTADTGTEVGFQVEIDYIQVIQDR